MTYTLVIVSDDNYHKGHRNVYAQRGTWAGNVKSWFDARFNYRQLVAHTQVTCGTPTKDQYKLAKEYNAEVVPHERQAIPLPPEVGSPLA